MSGCRQNPSLFVPPLVAFATYTVLFDVAPILLQVPLVERFDDISPSVLLFGLIGMSAVALISFLVLLGQVAMTSKVVTEGKTRLADWDWGDKKYFYRVLGVSLVFFFIIGVAILGSMDRFVLLPLANSADVYGLRLFLLLFLSSLPFSIARCFYYLWLASVVLDNAGVRASFILGVKAIRRNGNVFAGFVLLFFIVSVSGSLVSYSHVLPMIGSLSVTSIVFRLIGEMFSALWLLFAFFMYQ